MRVPIFSSNEVLFGKNQWFIPNHEIGGIKNFVHGYCGILE